MVYTTLTVGFVALEWFPSYLLKFNESIFGPMPSPVFFFKGFLAPKTSLSPFTKNPSGEVPVGESNLTVPVETHRGNYSHFMIYTRSSSSAGRRFPTRGCRACCCFSPPPPWQVKFRGFHSRPDF